MHRKQRKKNACKLILSKKKGILHRVSKEKRRVRSKSKVSGVSRKKKAREKKKEQEWRRNAIKPETLPLPNPQLNIPRIIDDNLPLPCSQLHWDSPSQTLLRRGRSRGSANNACAMAGLTLNQKIDSLRNRIKAIHIPGRPVTDSRDPEILGHELKLRLATRAPLLEEVMVKDGLVTFTESPASIRRHVTMYDITIDDDIYKACEVRVPKPSATTIMLERLLNNNKEEPSCEDFQASNRNPNNNNSVDESQDISQQLESPNSGYGRIFSCPLM